MFKINCLLLSLLVISTITEAQVSGCTDPRASNFNAAATINNGTCTYITTAYTPPIKVDPITDSLIETSGLQMAGNALWSFNDKDGSPTIYRIDTLTNALLQRVTLEGAINVDWEDIAFDGTHFYIGDFGNNLTGARRDLTIYKFALNSIPGYQTHPVATVPAMAIEQIRFSYSNQPANPVDTAANSTRFDCEAMIVDHGKIHLFSKNWVNQSTTHYIIDDTIAGNYIAQAMDTLPVNFLVTAADKVPGQNIIVLLGYQNTGFGNHFMYLLTDYPGNQFFKGNKRRLDLPDATVMGQAEGICFSSGKSGYISNEKFVRSAGPFTITVNQKLRSFNLEAYSSNYFTQYIFNGQGNWSDVANWKNRMKPPANIYAGNEITIDPAGSGQCVLDIHYSMPPGSRLTVAAGKNLLVQGSLTVQ